MSKRTVTIVGGRGKMGKVFAHALQKSGCIVHVCDRDNRSEWPHMIGESDIVVISVPISGTGEVIAEIAPMVAPGALVTDVTSVKMFPVDALCAVLPQSCEIVGGHPLFGPTVEWVGQHFICCDVRIGKNGRWYKEFLMTSGLKVIDMTPEEHDRHMAVIQCLTHFSNLSLGVALEHMRYDLGQGEKIATPVYQMRLYGAGRILAQDPQLYADIQKYNPYAKEVARLYRTSVEELYKTVIDDDVNGFVTLFDRAKTYFGDMTERSLKKTDQLIAYMTRMR